MAFLTGNRGKKTAHSLHLTSCLSTSHKAVVMERDLTMFSTLTDGQSVRRRSTLVKSFYPVTVHTHSRTEAETEEKEKQQRWRREGTNLLRPRQLSLEVHATKKVAMVTKMCEQRKPGVRSVTPLKPRAWVSGKQPPRSCTRPSSSCKARARPHSRAQDTSSRRLSPLHSQQLLPRRQKPVFDVYSHQNSGRSPRRPAAPLPQAHGSAGGPQAGAAGGLRSSRRRRGLPPDAGPAPVNHSGSSKRCRTLRYKDDGSLLNRESRIGEEPLKKRAGEECGRKSQAGRNTQLLKSQCGGVREVTPGSRTDAEQVDRTDPDAPVKSQDVTTNCELANGKDAVCKRKPKLQMRRGPPVLKPGAQTGADGPVAKTSMSPTRVHARPAGRAARRGAKQRLTKNTSPAPSRSPQNAAANGSVKASTDDGTKQRVSSTSKSTTSTIRTRSSPRVPLKH